MKYLLVQVWKKAGMRAKVGVFILSGKFDTLEEAQTAREQTESPEYFEIIQGW